MQAITYQNIKIEGAPITKITDLTISNAANSYGSVKLSGEIEKSIGESFISRADSSTCITITTSAAGQPPVLFKGVIESAALSKTSEYTIINLTMRAMASKLNTKKKTEAFKILEVPMRR